MVTVYTPDAIRYALSQIKDGTIFENFILDFLSKIFGYQFIPAGGLKDRGIDGLEHTFHRRELKRTVYQISIEKDFKAKIKDTLDKLQRKKVKLTQFVYISNQQIHEKDLLQDELVESYKLPINIYDLDWLANHVNDSDSTIRSFNIFVESYFHEFNKPGKAYAVTKLELDPRVYVYLRQQVEEKQNDLKLDEILADTLILYALGETDPDKGIFLKRDQIYKNIKNLVKFNPVLLGKLIDKRLSVLSSKPRRINHHEDIDAYCLQYEERLATQNRNLNDAALSETFIVDTTVMIDTYSPGDTIFKNDVLPLVLDLVHTLFYRQGIEFANFVMQGAGTDTFEKSLPELVDEIVDRTSNIKGNRQFTKTGLLTIIRNIVYNGTQNQKEFLTRLSRTYVMLLLLQCDPQLCTYFGSLASKLRIYVGTSIIIPALSEVYLEETNRRYTNLLLGARNAGVKLMINEAILRELVAHFRMITNIFKREYEGQEEVFTDELAVIYIREIMLRAFFYSRIRGQVDSFEDFIRRFTSPSLKNMPDDLVELLKSEFGIEYAPNSHLGIHLNGTEVNKIEEELKKYKGGQLEFGSKMKAHTDAEIMLTIHSLRDRDNELGTTGIFGYHTWWLTSDVTTQKAAVRAAGDRYSRTCYMRPDFLYNYISLAPQKGQVEESFRHLFPTLLGISLSWELPTEATREIQKFLKEHKEAPQGRLKGVIRELIDNLKQTSDSITSEFVRDYIDKHFKE